MVSVIIPAYNVESYIERCVESVFAQTYTDLEIIIVDDGAKDRTPMICDQLAMRDSRVKVVHKLNGGLSSARNAGIDAANGEYIMFVDSDDWLHPDCVRLLYADIEHYGVKMAMGGFSRVTEKEVYDEYPNTDAECIEKNVAIPRMLHGEWISAWSKLYHRSLWKDVRFPVGLNNEDYAVLIRVFEQCDSVTYRKDSLYFYYIREGSICRSAMNSHSFDEFETGQMVWNYCKEHYPQWANIALFNLSASIIKLTSRCLEESQFMDKYETMKKLFLSHKKEMLGNPELAIKYKPFLWSMMCGQCVHKLFLLVYHKYARR